jgi:peptide/nickel transport system substrate-binding protein
MGRARPFLRPGRRPGRDRGAPRPELDALIKELKTIMDLGKRDAMITKVARITHERVAGGLPTPRPIATLAWREAKVTFNPWPPPGFWRSL